ncbi:MAG: hypothetical protein IJZ68_09215 [Bacteroidaceae bacterium]|nr:hypothetical protein [Bacteroidaceae bacterium]
MQDKMKEIVKKIRELAATQNDPDIHDVVKTTPELTCFYVNDEVELDHIIFENDFDKLIISQTRMVYKPEFGEKRILFTYNGWDAMLQL